MEFKKVYVEESQKISVTEADVLEALGLNPDHWQINKIERNTIDNQIRSPGDVDLRLITFGVSGRKDKKIPRLPTEEPIKCTCPAYPGKTLIGYD